MGFLLSLCLFALVYCAIGFILGFFASLSVLVAVMILCYLYSRLPEKRPPQRVYVVYVDGVRYSVEVA
jgi:hypothetical protein